MSDFKELVKGYINIINEGAYSNGRYEHPEGKKINKYNPGHANPVFTHDAYIHNGSKVERTVERSANMPSYHGGINDNPMNPLGGGEIQYKKGEMPNGYIARDENKSAELHEACRNLKNTLSSVGENIGNDNLKNNPNDFIEATANNLRKVYKIEGATKIQQIRINKALAEYNKLLAEYNSMIKNNKKYDNSRSDRQIKKDARLWEKSNEKFNHDHNGTEETPQTQSREFRKKVNGDVIRNAFEEQKAREKAKEKRERIEYIKQKDEKNRKNQWTKEASDKREERQKK